MGRMGGFSYSLAQQAHEAVEAKAGESVHSRAAIREPNPRGALSKSLNPRLQREQQAPTHSMQGSRPSQPTPTKLNTRPASAQGRSRVQVPGKFEAPSGEGPATTEARRPRARTSSRRWPLQKKSCCCCL